MTKISDPVLFSEYFKVDHAKLENLGVFNPLLNIDAKLFIDPLLLQKSIHPEININAVNTYNDFFCKIIKLLSVSKEENDLAWRNAKRYLSFHEIIGTCLGYGASSIHGSAWGDHLQQQVLHTAKEIIDLGIDDPDLFTALALFEEGMGPDRISDMITNIILQDLISFNHRIIKELSLSVFSFNFEGIEAKLIQNPLEKSPIPIILVPLDILRNLPIVHDWSEISDAVEKNSILREQVSYHVGEIWQSKTRKNKNEIKRNALASKEAFSSLLDIVKVVPRKSYDFSVDKTGEVAWTRMLENDNILFEWPLCLQLNTNPSVDEVLEVVKEIIEQFRKLVEDKGLWKEFWANEKARPEKSAQRLFFAVADTYCKKNNIDITPEANSGNGPVDFKFSNGYKERVLVEIKLSSSVKLIPGYVKQLEAYKAAEETMRAIYLVIDLGNMKNKDQRLLDIKNATHAEGMPISDIVFIDAKKRLSASNR